MPHVLERRERRAIATLVLLLTWAAICCGCVFGGESDRDLSEYFPPPPQADAADEQPEDAANSGASTETPLVYTPPPERLEDLEVAPPSSRFAVQSFFHLVASGNLSDAYQRTARETRELIDIDGFQQRYRDIWAEATINGFSWELIPQENENASSHEVILRYQTTFFGEIEEIVQAPVLRQPHWVVYWTPELIFSGLGTPGTLISVHVQSPQRGQILDRNGAVLAGEAEIVTVGVDWDAITDEAWVIDFFVNRLQIEEEDVRALIYQDVASPYIEVAKLPFDTAPEVIAEFEQLSAQGILLSRRTQRFYPFADSATHVVGYLREINPEELDAWYVEGYRAGDWVGNSGVEQSFERVLAGKRGGSLLVIDQIGRPVREIINRPAVDGADIRLTLDIRVQQLAESALGDQPGATVAIDLRSGHILAMASYPRIDPNTIVDGVTEEEYETYFFDDRQPFINRAIEQLYPPASTFKAITLAAALEGGGFEITDRVSCPALWTKVGDTPLRNWKEVDQGRITLAQALAESCNTVFFELGLELDRQDDTILPATASGFGFGQLTGIIGLDEQPGLIPSPEWKRDQLDDAWYTGDTLNMSIGQGYVAVTVLQVANAYAALATNGVVGTPMIVQSIEASGSPPQLLERRSISVLPVSRETLEQLQASLRTTVSQPYGTGYYVFQGSPLRIAGKSGTTEDLVNDPQSLEQVAEQDEQDADAEDDQQQSEAQEEDAQAEETNAEDDQPIGTHAWFSAWANFEEPQLVVTVVLDDGRSGSDDAGPIVRRVLEGAILNGWVP